MDTVCIFTMRGVSQSVLGSSAVVLPPVVLERAGFKGATLQSHNVWLTPCLLVLYASTAGLYRYRTTMMAV